MNNIKYVHTNLIASDWRKLAEFYINVFGCKPVYPERDLSGEWVDQLTALHNVRIHGIHLSLPGYDNGPTLEIFEYQPDKLRNHPPQLNQQGFTHLAFHVDSVPEALEKLIENGGYQFGELIVKEYEQLGTLTVVYAEDPEGNFIELQNWKK